MAIKRALLFDPGLAGLMNIISKNTISFLHFEVLLRYLIDVVMRSHASSSCSKVVFDFVKSSIQSDESRALAFLNMLVSNGIFEMLFYKSRNDCD